MMAPSTGCFLIRANSCSRTEVPSNFPISTFKFTGIFKYSAIALRNADWCSTASALNLVSTRSSNTPSVYRFNSQAVAHSLDKPVSGSALINFLQSPSNTSAERGIESDLSDISVVGGNSLAPAPATTAEDRDNWLGGTSAVVPS